MNTQDSTPAPQDGEKLYVPGYAKLKFLMTIYGVLLFSLGLSHIWTPLRLVFFGERARAEVIAVVKTKDGLPDARLTNNGVVEASLEPNDGSYIFWNEFQFLTNKGEHLHIRATVGSRKKPLYSLTDLEGLRTTDTIFYDPSNPNEFVFPFIVSTWFASGVLIVAGLVCAIVGATLLYWAHVPIKLPHISN